MEIKNLQVGNWYKSKIGNYFKFKEFTNNYFYSSEEIFNKIWQGEAWMGFGGRLGAGWWIKELTEINLSEIQEFLPKDHPDKSESLVGRWVKRINNKNSYSGGTNVVKIGEYDKITGFIGYDKYNLEKFQSILKSDLGSDWELMPEGFKPPTMKQESTELPEKWSIKITNENLEILKKFSGQSNYLHTIIGAYLLYSKDNFDCWSWNKETSSAFYTEITFEQFKKWVLKEKKPKFEVGKWYKSDKNKIHNVIPYMYIKFEDYKSNGYIKGEGIDSSGTYVKDKQWGIAECINRALELGPMTDLSEIQQFLPDSHVDKIVKQKNQITEYIECLENYSNMAGINFYEKKQPELFKKNKITSVEVLPLQKPCLISTKKKKLKLIFN